MHKKEPKLLDELDAQTRRVVVDNLANQTMGQLAHFGYGMNPEDYKQLLVEVLDRIAGSLDYIGEGKLELRPIEPNPINDLMVTVD
jgi:hypothetical protein